MLYQPTAIGPTQRYAAAFDLGPADGPLPKRIVVRTDDEGVVLSRNVVRGDDPVDVADVPVTKTRPTADFRAGIATVIGTDLRDIISARRVGSLLVVSATNSDDILFDLDRVEGLVIEGGKGDDILSISTRTGLDIPTTLRGNAGVDQLTGATTQVEDG